MPGLAHTRVAAERGEPVSWILFLHGIYGAGRNWSTVARRLVEQRPEWGGILVDLRLHGASAGFGAPHTVRACAEDVAALIGRTGLSAEAVLGHSFGGKVALELAGLNRARLRQVWVVDSTPGARPPGGEAVRMLEAVRGLRGTFEARSAAVESLQALGFSPSVAGWMTSNLERRGRGYAWRFDPDDMESLLRDFFRTDLWEVIESPPGSLEIHVVKARASQVLDERGWKRLGEIARVNPRIVAHRLEGGHWLNADNPDAIVALLTDHLPRPSANAPGAKHV
ncbi:MAG: alpha/beta fold hydrolase [Gemmatimonadota bacterium]